MAALSNICSAMSARILNASSNYRLINTPNQNTLKRWAGSNKLNTLRGFLGSGGRRKYRQCDKDDENIETLFWCGLETEEKNPKKGQTERIPIVKTESINPRKEQYYSEEDKERRRRIEAELKDSRNFIDYLAPRPLRRAFFAASAASCSLAFIISLSKVITNPSLELAEGGLSNVGINLAGIIIFGTLYWYDGRQGEKGVERRKVIRDAQIRVGDREVFVNSTGETMSRLKQVDDDWIIRRLDRWGQKDLLPQIGPKKGAILQGLVAEKNPIFAVEVGSFTGYSAIKIAQAMPDGSNLVSLESDWKWTLVAKRFVWQAKLSDRVDVRWGDAIKEIPKLQYPIDFLFLDGKPWEYIEYLRAAEPLLSSGAVVVADNAGVFKSQLSGYLEYVRQSPLYESRFVETTLEYRDEIPDGIEVSVFLGNA